MSGVSVLVAFHTAHLRAVKAIRAEWADELIPAAVLARALWHMDECEKFKTEIEQSLEGGAADGV